MGIVKVSRSKSFLDNFYLPAILAGLVITIRHFVINIITGKKIVTINYPEEKREIAPRWRGRHRLTRDNNGFIKCVACFMCETICPAHCIHIESAEQVNDKTVEKYPAVFDIDELRCIFCGLCVEACPKDAIRMDSNIIGLAYNKRNKFDYTRNLLLDAEVDNDLAKYSNIPLPENKKQALPNSVATVVGFPEAAMLNEN